MAKGGAKESCTADGCSRTRVGWGYCSLHYARLMRSGSIRPSHRSQARAETIGADGKRKCWKCGERKPYTPEHFYADKRHPGELKGTCKSCCRRAVRAANIRRTYGLTIDQHDRMLEAQGGACAICREPFVSSERGKSVQDPHVDHDHATGALRGLLCHHCNVMLGHAKDSTRLLRDAISYLEKTHAVP